MSVWCMEVLLMKPHGEACFAIQTKEGVPKLLGTPSSLW